MGKGRGNCDAKLLAVLSAGCTIADAAKQTGLSERTICRRLDDQAFRLELERLKDEAISCAVSRLADASISAVDTLKKLLTGQSETVALGAARAILELGYTLRERSEFGARLTRLEARQHERERLETAENSRGKRISADHVAGTGLSLFGTDGGSTSS